MAIVSHPTAVNWNSSPQVSVAYVGPGSYFVQVIDPKAQTLHVVNDELLTRPEAHELARQVKQQLALQRLAADAKPNRMARAIALMADGKVSRNGAGYYVQSQTCYETAYHVGPDGCQCPDKTYNHAPQCKHEIAVQLHARMETPAEFDQLLASATRYTSDADLADVDTEAIGLDESRNPFAY